MSETLRWQQALAFALVGEVGDDLPRSGGVDAAGVLADLGLDRVARTATEREAAGLTWPYPVPDDLRAGLGAAQWFAALTQARLLVAEHRARTAGRVVRDRPLDGAESRLAADRPPHWG